VLMRGSIARCYKALWPRAKRLEWVHSMWAGLRGCIPELVESAVPLTQFARRFSRAPGRVCDCRHAALRQADRAA